MLQTFYYDPFRALAPRARVRRREAETAQWRPAVDIIETEAQYQLVLDLPGIDPQSIDVTEEKHVLTISAERSARELAEGETLTRSERKIGRYQRQFTLPEDVEVETISARSVNGELIVTLQRKQPVETQRKITIE
ncbi:MAG: Hsp20/alpha crystallin family protein [Gammaproteobacteria bacterium]|nr:Hsp20/alpha crystallin family protein [Gammaproteobacteria bacterium]